QVPAFRHFKASAHCHVEGYVAGAANSIAADGTESAGRIRDEGRRVEKLIARLAGTGEAVMVRGIDVRQHLNRTIFPQTRERCIAAAHVYRERLAAGDVEEGRDLPVADQPAQP